ncbi:MlaA family lipoprotein [Lysobacter sp. CA199]|uniref:MlaA family lipoprotein n=1 Tax=Lysobacter sp. CA199 TaxID=3455608 RepID=UPI003F8CF8AE
MKFFQSVLLAAMVLAATACAGKPANLRTSASTAAERVADEAARQQVSLSSTANESPSSGEGATVALAAPTTNEDADVAGADRTQIADGDDALDASLPMPPASEDSAEVEDVAATLYARAAVRDPWERYNRRIHRFNNVVDKHVLRPLAVGYIKVVPPPVRSGVSRFFGNLGEPANAINQALQGDPLLALKSLGRFAVNTTLGIGGVLDPAARMGLAGRDGEDLGQTLAVWGWRNSRYLVMPFLGPRTVRDSIAIVGDQRLAPIGYLNDSGTASALQLLEIVDGRTQLMSIDRMRQDAYDDYTFVRDAWTQRRNHQIDKGDRGD